MATSNDHPATSKALRGVLFTLGAISTAVAVNVAFGGLETLGLQGPTSYVEITDPGAYAIRDSHAHYYGGVYVALGLFLMVASTNVQRHRSTLHVVLAMIFAGGLARLTQLEPDVTFGSDLLPSTVIELLGMPLLAWWVARTTNSSDGTIQGAERAVRA